jgi:hypothetical protein
MAVFDRAEFTEIAVSGVWSSADSMMSPGYLSLHGLFDVSANELFASIEYSALRLAAEYGLPFRLFVQADARWARYKKGAWMLDDHFLSSYFEIGYRHRYGEITLGVGLDPVVLDPVTSRYSDIGREEFVRQAIPRSLGRDRAFGLGTAIAVQEAALEDEYPIKLEAIIHF